MNIKTKSIVLLILSCLFLNIYTTEAKTETISDKITQNQEIKNISLEKIFIYFSKFFEEETPESYKYISLNYNWFQKGSELEKALQILVYNNKIPNSITNLSWISTKQVTATEFFKLASNILWTSEQNYWTKIVDYYDLEIVEESYKVLKNKKVYEENYFTNPYVQSFWTMWILNDVYSTIANEHFDKDLIDKNKLLYSAIEWLANSTWDKHTVYFPPTESQDFLSSLSGDFEWIWAYVEMPQPWFFIITSPISWWWAEKAGIKWWDQVIAVDGKEITKENSQNEIVSWIRWKSGTEVTLKIKRWNQILEIKVTRQKVHLISVETKSNWNSFIIKINAFNENVSGEFKKAVEELNTKNWVRKIIFDLRNNWGWFLDEVVTILSYMIPKGESVAHVKYIDTDWEYISKGYNLLDPSKYEIVFLQNTWTASASEIMIWTMKDYFPNTKIVWEKSYWKGSVQSIKEFFDGSSFKYTIAKWFTWKTKTWIDWVGITPDIKIELDENKLKNYNIDTQMQKALSI